MAQTQTDGLDQSTLEAEVLRAYISMEILTPGRSRETHHFHVDARRANRGHDGSSDRGRIFYPLHADGSVSAKACDGAEVVFLLVLLPALGNLVRRRRDLEGASLDKGRIYFGLLRDCGQSASVILRW